MLIMKFSNNSLNLPQNKKLILLDIDNTVFDSSAYRVTLFEKICEVLDRREIKEDFVKSCHFLADDMLRVTGMFDVEKLVDAILERFSVSKDRRDEVMEHLYKPEYTKMHVYDEVLGVLDRLNKLGEVGILSQGEDRFQRTKLVSFLHYLSSKHIHIHSDKRSEMNRIFKQYLQNEVYYVDDMLIMLVAAKNADENVKPIWIKRGKYALTQDSIAGFVPWATVDNLSDIIELIAKD